MTKVTQKSPVSHGIAKQMRNFSQSDSSFRGGRTRFVDFRKIFKFDSFYRQNCSKKENTITSRHGGGNTQEREEGSNNEYPLFGNYFVVKWKVHCEG